MFKDDKYKNLVNDISNMMKSHKAVGSELPDHMRSAAIQAGVEAREAKTLEDRNATFSKHLTTAADGVMYSNKQAGTFYNIAQHSMEGRVDK